MRRLHIEWLDGGSVPTFDLYDEPADRVVATGYERQGWGVEFQVLEPASRVDTRPWWRLTHAHHRLVVPVMFDGTLPELERDLPELIEAVDGLPGWDSTLVFAVRTAATIPDVGRYALFGLACVPGWHRFPTAAPVRDFREASDTVLDWIRGIEGRDSRTLHQAVRDALARAMERREALDRERQRVDALLAANFTPEDVEALHSDVETVLDWAAHGPDDAALIEQCRDALARRTARHEAAEKARVASRILLLSCLDQGQRIEFEAHGEFHVVLVDGRRFKIGAKQSHNILEIVEGQAVVEYCIVAKDYIPLHDHMLSQKLLLESDPDTFFKIANHRACAAG